MNRKLIIIALCILSINVNAGNTDRAGEAGAYELLINPFSRTMGMYGINSASVRGINAIGTNIAGLAYNKKLTTYANYTSWLSGTETSIVNIGVAGEISEGNTLAFNVNYLSFGRIDLTTTNSSSVIGTFSPYMMNIGLSYARRFSSNVNGGLTMKLISEGNSVVSATGVSLDAGLQYTTGDLDDLHFGVFVRNLGFPMSYSGDGLTYKRPPTSTSTYELPYNQRSAEMELPAQFSIAVTKDLFFGTQPEKNDMGICRPQHRVSISSNFVYNSFVADNFGLGAEYSFREKYEFRLGYLYENQGFNSDATNRAHMGLAAGFSVNVPMASKKSKNNSNLEVSYNFRPTWVFNGTHNVGITYYIHKSTACDVKLKTKKIAEEAKEAVKTKPVKPKTITKYDTIIVRDTIEKEVEYSKVNNEFSSFASNIEFKRGSAELTPRGQGALDIIAKLMKRYPNEKFVISGHTDNNGTPQNNMILSKNRAIAVAKYLVINHNISEEKLQVEYYGQDKPIYSNSTEEGQIKNRRVEIEILDSKSKK